MMTNLLLPMKRLGSVHTVLAILAAVAVLLTNAAEHLVHHVTGITDQSVTLSCGAHDGFQLRDVTWSDGVYADDETTKAVIFRSENNAKRQIEEAHPNRANYRIDADFRLTISNLQSTDTGAYICRSTGASGAPHDRLYELSIASKPECTSTEALTMKEGQTADFSCEMLFGTRSLIPRMNWHRGTDPIESIDQFEPGLAKKDLHVTATVDDDRNPYRCVTKLGDVTGECSITLIVPHSVRQVKFVDAKSTYYIGDEIRCSAKGSPLPVIKLSPTVTSSSGEQQVVSLVERSGDGWRSIVIPNAWDRKHVTVNCTASNTVDGKHASEMTSVAFNVTVPPRAAAGSANRVHWHASQFDTFVTSLISLLLTTWPVVIAQVIR